MVESLSDIEALTLQCRSENSKSYISEAILCYRSGAHRAAIVSTWIAVVFDLVDKIRELALSGDKPAKCLEAKYEAYVAQIEENHQQGLRKALEFEREIIKLCADNLEFFDQQQMTDLMRLKEDRHRCAHPSFQTVGIPYRPSAEQARLHIRNAIVHVLSQRPVQGKAALAKVKVTVSSEYFPLEEEKAIDHLKTAGLDRPTDALVNSVIDHMVFGFVNKDDQLFQKKQVIVALNAIYVLFPGLFEERLRKQVNKLVHNVEDDLFLLVAYLVAKTKLCWALLEDSARYKIERFILAAQPSVVLKALSAFADFCEVQEAVAKRIGKLDPNELAIIAGEQNIRDLVKARAIDLLAEARSWDQANGVFYRLMFPIIDHINLDDLRKIIRLPMETGADLIGSHGLQLFVENVRSAGLVPEGDLDRLLEENNLDYLVKHVKE